MAKDKPLTKTVLVKTLKEMGMATKDDILKSEHRLERRLVIRMNKMERGLRLSIADLAETTPTRREFETLKRQSHYGLV
ncbi:hypothetical protein A3I57_03515 [Candidatus Beckwithbacteria bacterium RIFCSPLOWO2_02_FULL_47_23]|uniref:Uncharacterized protein n=2 Tax=Candidatus Beckwithiibacteriota TaxID=1752726 RepID=A0A1F5E340_9BACT|nr:MAG: hypothetical protein A3E73_03030 [Candidatus Beckwithbacteria bacterium RIFCSPHIGHO2_12_FULL_47_17]OGD61815.1 MAG: hypothetical protein A3I57_03515 [Candidatus Beckwithbacteria bacterium RIFCSPLOWO2_02_FULL_47_23]